MLQFGLVVFIVLFMSACGVETSSSPYDSTTSGTSVPTDPNDTNPTDPTSPESNTSDPDAIDSTFDTLGAVYDANACNVNSYKFVSDTSYSGTQTGENGASLLSVIGNGLMIGSEHLEPDTNNASKTWVTLFYKSFPDPASLDIQGYASYLMDGVFYLSYDIAWSDESIPNVDNTVYIQSVKDEKPACYRAVLNSAIGSDIDVQKVYR